MDGKRQERRLHFRGRARAGRRVELEYRLAGDEAGEGHRAVTSNIGVGGAFVLTGSPLPVGTDLLISLTVPTAEAPIETNAQVRWVVTADEADELHSAGMGIKFLRLDVEALLQLSEYFASLTRVTAADDPTEDGAEP
jgi:uncharacterized protein (TIGR02266 family)